jgi:polysaccharide biosynthesis protein PslA
MDTPDQMTRSGAIPGLPGMDGLVLRVLAPRPVDHGAALVKLAIDQGGGLVLAAAVLPLCLLVALAIRLESPGPVLFRQRRHGLDNREFLVFKFRTMAWREGGNFEQTRRNDSRVTRLGRLLRASSLDELPQLLNVLRGEMSLVGPRPHAVDMRTAGLTGPEITPRYVERHRVKPGMTGWAQVNGSRGATVEPADVERRVALDLHYIEHWSPWLDLRILVRTVGVVIRGTNAY